MTNVITTTNRDRTRWQAPLLRLLDEVWHRGAAADLRPLMWSLGVQGLAGYASSSGTDGEATLRAWAELLELEVVQITPLGSSGLMRLYAKSESYGAAGAPLLISVDMLDEVQA